MRRRTTKDENNDICRIMPTLIREICINLSPIFEGDHMHSDAPSMNENP